MASTLYIIFSPINRKVKKKIVVENFKIMQINKPEVGIIGEIDPVFEDDAYGCLPVLHQRDQGWMTQHLADLLFVHFNLLLNFCD